MEMNRQYYHSVTSRGYPRFKWVTKWRMTLGLF